MHIRRFATSDYNSFRIPPFPQGGEAWVGVTHAPIAYVACIPLPGLPHIADLYGAVQPAWRRMGYGSHLLRHLLKQIEGGPIRQIAAPCSDLHSDAALFLQANGFEQSHEEYDLVLHNPASLPLTGHSLTQYPLELAAPLLRALYKNAFQGTAWYQPYRDDAELLDDLGAGSDIFFLEQENRPTGFAAVRYSEKRAEIEPFGIIAERQGHGFGRLFLHTLLNHLGQREIAAVHLTVWSGNTIARQLYRQAGFSHHATRIYLARNITAAPPVPPCP
jgi:ribosomal protein S18 acetylase RimI-like enzyme